MAAVQVLSPRDAGPMTPPPPSSPPTSPGARSSRSRSSRMSPTSPYSGSAATTEAMTNTASHTAAAAALLAPFPRSSASDPKTVLADLMDSDDWDRVLDRLHTHPSEASVPIQRYGGPSLPLHEACKLGSPPDVVRALIEANPSAATTQDPFSSSLPLHVAVQFGASVELVEALLEAYPRGTRRRAEGGALPLHQACRWGASADVIERLLWVYPEGVHVMDDKGYTPRMYAEEYSGEDVLDVTRRAGTGFCQVSRAASIRLKEDYDERLRGVVSAHDARIVETNRLHASELVLRDAVEERLRSNLKRMKVHYTALEREIAHVTGEKRRLFKVRRSGLCPPAVWMGKATRVEALEDKLLESMAQMSSMLRESDTKEEEPRFVADVLESDLVARTAQLRETNDDLDQTREQVNDLLRRMDEVLDENRAQREEIRRLNRTIEGLAECVDRLAPSPSTLFTALDRRERALVEVVESRNRYVLREEWPSEEGDDDADDNNNNCDADCDAEEGYVWQMGPSPPARKSDRREQGRYDGLWSERKGRVAEGKGAKDYHFSVDVVSAPSVDRSATTKVGCDKATVATAITYDDMGSIASRGPEAEDMMLSVGDRTNEDMPRWEQQQYGNDDDPASNASFESHSSLSGKFVVQAEAGTPERKEAEEEASARGAGTPKSNPNSGEQRHPPPSEGEGEGKGEGEAGEEKNVLAIAANIDKSLTALQAMLSDNPQVLDALRQVRAPMLGQPPQDNTNAPMASRGNGKTKRSPGGKKKLATVLSSDYEEEIELVKNNSPDKSFPGGGNNNNDDANDADDEAFYGCLSNFSQMSKMSKPAFVNAVQGGCDEASTMEVSLGTNESNTIVTDDNWSFDDDHHTVTTLKNQEEGVPAACGAIPIWMDEFTNLMRG